MANNTIKGRQKHAVIGQGNTGASSVPLKGEIIFNSDLDNLRVGDGSKSYSQSDDLIPAPMTDTDVKNILGIHDYVEIGGIKWATMNVGASSITDTGLYFQWGDTQGYTAAQVGSGSGQKAFSWNDYKYTNDGGSTMSKYNSTDGLTTLQKYGDPTQSDDVVYSVWGGNWRMPTEAESQELLNAVNTVWTSNYNNSGVRGMVCTDKTDSSKVLFFPSAGFCEYGQINDVYDMIVYWISSLYTDYNSYAYCISYSNGSPKPRITYFDRCYGMPIRGILDE